jgi:hypothetical protein
MDGELLPESIRGGWYFVPTDEGIGDAADAEAEKLVFYLDETFARYEISQGERELGEEGDYTFDGQFLILRGSDTDTYRVEAETAWRWELEGKKDEHLLLRGWTDLEEPFELGEERLREIESVPARVFVRSEFGGPRDTEVCSLVHESYDEELVLGACYAEPSADALWIAMTPFTVSISDSLWRRIVRRSYLDIYRDDDREAEYIEILR